MTVISIIKLREWRLPYSLCERDICGDSIDGGWLDDYQKRVSCSQCFPSQGRIRFDKRDRDLLLMSTTLTLPQMLIAESRITSPHGCRLPTSRHMSGTWCHLAWKWLGMNVRIMQLYRKFTLVVPGRFL